MSETVKGLEVYHLCHQKDYVYHSALSPGQCFTAGKTVNPFFGYYDKARTYKVEAGGSTQDVPAIKFLRDIKNGHIECPDLAREAYRIANHYSMLARELIMEEMRLKTAPDAPSRKTCLWVVDDIGLAAYWKRKIGGPGSIVRLSLTGTVHRCDAKHLMNESEPIEETYKKAQLYWEGAMSTDPLPEILFEGNATVLEVDLVAPATD